MPSGFGPWARVLFLPYQSPLCLPLAWAIGLSVMAFCLARRKNRSLLGWVLLSGSTAFFFGLLGLAWIVLLATREPVSMRSRYLSLKMEERIAEALGMPSPLRGKDADRVLMVLANNPQGLRIGAIGQAIGRDWRQIQGLIEDLLSRGKIRKEGDRYFFNLD